MIAGILTVSDACSRGDRADLSGPALAEGLMAAGIEVVFRATVPDEAAEITSALRQWIGGCDVIVTTGGTGFAPRDVTPEATAAVIERDAPGIAEMLRWTGYQKTAFAALSRGRAGIAGRTIIVNLPGSPKAVAEGLESLIPLLPHAVALLRDEPAQH